MPKRFKAVLENNGGHTKYLHFYIQNIDISENITKFIFLYNDNNNTTICIKYFVIIKVFVYVKITCQRILKVIDYTCYVKYEYNLLKYCSVFW